MFVIVVNEYNDKNYGEIKEIVYLIVEIMWEKGGFIYCYFCNKLFLYYLMLVFVVSLYIFCICLL